MRSLDDYFFKRNKQTSKFSIFTEKEAEKQTPKTKGGVKLTERKQDLEPLIVFVNGREVEQIHGNTHWPA